MLYLIGCFGLYFMQHKILFRPAPLSEYTQFRFGQEVKIPVEEDVDLHALYHQVNNPKGAILYLHGNRGNVRWCQRQAEMFAGFGYNVLLLDYRGYGKSEGQLSNGTQLYKDAQKVYDYLREQFEENEILVAGYSIGTGVASYLAAHNQPKALFMIAPYINMMDMKNRYFPLIPNFLLKFKLNNKKHLELLGCPVTIFHGTEDEVIPYDSSVQLKESFPDKINLVTLPNVSHRRAIFHGAIRTQLESLL